ncbi:hypothetical protein K7X08_031617 [Anisodus acutangulus]|uniref:DNA mismatch repair protein MutS clamp domain-containing protein n=1 Tax=Anisodus acutangulus TaxID=402998 RepID=A0A9Q1RMB1_9SOLA|nr:hypothetical protein K7X08_031617 [Anisodus acutangulus]
MDEKFEEQGKLPELKFGIRIPFIKSILKRYDGKFATLIRERYIDPLEKWSDDNHLNKFIALVETAVDLDQLENGEYMISSAYDQSLSALKDEQETLEQQIHNLLKQTANDLDLPIDKSLKLDKGTQFGHVFRITKKEEPKVRRQLNSHYIVLETRLITYLFGLPRLGGKVGFRLSQALIWVESRPTFGRCWCECPDGPSWLICSM